MEATDNRRASKEAKKKKEETEEERKARKERERAERKAKEKTEGAAAPAEGKAKKEETEEERKARKERERAERKAKEAAAAAAAAGAESAEPKKKETEEERKARKERERAERKAKEKAEEGTTTGTSKEKPAKETEEERKARKERERAERKAKEAKEGDADRAAKPKSEETEEERKARKEKERAERKAKEAAETSKRSGGDTHKHDDLLAALEAENRTAVLSARKEEEAMSKAARQREDLDRELANSARKEERRKDREERKRQKELTTPAPDDSGVADSSSARGKSGRTGLDAGDLQRQGYRAQFEKDLARATALRRLVDLDDTTAVLLDVAPQSEYDMYIRSFGQSGKVQVGVQAPPQEDRTDREVQVERVKQRAFGQQAPDDLGLYPEQYADRKGLRRGATDGGEGAAGGGAASARDQNNKGGNGEESKEAATTTSASDGRTPLLVDAGLLGNFLSRVFPVVSALLDENTDPATVEATKAKSATNFSSSYTSLCFSGTRNRPVRSTRFCASSPQHLAALYGDIDGPGASWELDRFTSVVLLWNLLDTSAPERALVSFARVSCVSWSPSRPYLLYGGCEDGSVCAWDTREPDRQHLPAGRFQRLVFRLPSYSSSWQSENHAAPVRQICVAGYNTIVGVRKDESEQLASLDATGVVKFWALNDKDQSKAVISESDYGVHMGSTVRLYLANATRGGGDGSGGANGLARDDRYRGVGSSDVLGDDDDDGAGDGTSAHYAIQRTLGADEILSSEVNGTLTPVPFAGAGESNGNQGPASRANGQRGGEGELSASPLRGGRWQRAEGFDFAPTDASRYVVTLAQGIHHRSRFGAVTAPSLYGPSSHFFDAMPAAVPTCVQYSPLESRVLVAGYDDGLVRVYTHTESTPQLTVELGCNPVVQIQCSHSVRWMTWALDESGTLHLLDHAHRQREVPVLSQSLTQPDTGTCLCMGVPTEEKAEHRLLALGFEKGMIQVHTLDNEKLQTPASDRDEHWL